MTQRLVERTGGLLGRRTSRRGFLVRAAAVGSAVAIAPIRSLVRPLPAWALEPSQCSGRSRCGSGYSEFCCAIVGYNGPCPHGSFVGGWWKAHSPTGSQYCNGGPRFYVDCNLFHKSDCGGSGCHNGTCNCYGRCTNRFSYRNCNTRYQRHRSSWVLCRYVLCSNPCNQRCGASRTQPGCHCKCGGTHPDNRTAYHSSCDGCST